MIFVSGPKITKIILLFFFSTKFIFDNIFAMSLPIPDDAPVINAFIFLLITQLSNLIVYWIIFPFLNLYF